ncbi:MAG: hypothetical protein ACMXYF_01340 [Candidatus Woesearchaeota archaeon]
MVAISLEEYKQELEEYEQKREQLIIQARIVLTKAKKLIFLVHKRSQIDTLKEQVIFEFETLRQLVLKAPLLQQEGMYSEASQEYCEAILFSQLVLEQPLAKPKDLEVTTTDYLLGLCDVTGEIVRFVVQNTIERQFDRALILRNIVQDIYEQLLTLNQRHAHLRKKVDMVRWNLQKLDDIIYDLTIRDKLENTHDKR